MSMRLLLDDTDFLIEMTWEFLEASDVTSRSRKKGGLAIKGANALQFAEGDGENGIAVLAAWVAGRVGNGMAMLPLPDNQCWVCGILAGLIAPETDRIVSYDDLAVMLELLEDMVPDERYFIRAAHVSFANGDLVACSDLVVPKELESAHALPLEELQDVPKISGFHQRDTRRLRQILMATTAVACVGAAGYMGFHWWQDRQIAQQQTVSAEDLQRKSMLERQRLQMLAEAYRDSHQAMNIYQAVRNVLGHFALKDSGWDLQRVVVNDSVKAEYKRGKGLLANFLEGKKQVTWSKDGGSAELRRELKNDIPIPMESYDLQVMDDIRAITMMQQIGSNGVQAGLLGAAPKWASTAPAYSLLSGVKNIYWKIAVPFSRLQSAMSLLQHSNVAVGEVDLNIAAKNCTIEGLIYVSKG